MVPKRLLAIGLFAAAVFAQAGVSRAQWVKMNGTYGGNVTSLASIGKTFSQPHGKRSLSRAQNRCIDTATILLNPRKIFR